MAGKTKINGTSYTVSGGNAKINGTKHTIAKGRTKINGTSYDIIFQNKSTIQITSAGSTSTPSFRRSSSYIKINGVSKTAIGEYELSAGDSLEVYAYSGSSTVILDVENVDIFNTTGSGKWEKLYTWTAVGGKSLTINLGSSVNTLTMLLEGIA